MYIRSSKVIFSRLGLSWVYIYNITERFPYRTHTHTLHLSSTDRKTHGGWSTRPPFK